MPSSSTLDQACARLAPPARRPLPIWALSWARLPRYSRTISAWRPTSPLLAEASWRSWLTSTDHLLVADKEIDANPGDYFDRIVEIDLAKLEPHIVGPHSPDRARPISQLAAEVKDPKNQFVDEICDGPHWELYQFLLRGHEPRRGRGRAGACPRRECGGALYGDPRL